jgi:prepilin-type N-terminal cleavage/methylation domain-containing protein
MLKRGVRVVARFLYGFGARRSDMIFTERKGLDMWRDNRGFTLLELMIAMLLSLLVMGVSMASYSGFRRTTTIQDVGGKLEQSLRTAMNLMNYDLTMTGYGTGDGIVTASANEIVIEYDRNEDGDISPDSDRFGYRLSGTTLQKAFYKADGTFDRAQALIQNVKTFNLVYYDGSYPAVATGIPQDIRTVEINLEVEREAAVYKTMAREFTMRFNMRNQGLTPL